MSEQSLWHGWARAGNATAPSLYIGPLPGRKSICLYTDYGIEGHALAFFPSEEKAREALAVLDWLISLEWPGNGATSPQRALEREA